MSTHWDLHANSRATARNSFLSFQFFFWRTFLAMAWPTCPRCICLLSFTFDRAQMLNIGCWTFFACMLNIPPWLRENTHLDCRSLGRTKLTLREHLFKSGGSVTEGNLTFKGSLVTTQRFSFEFLYIGLININKPPILRVKFQWSENDGNTYSFWERGVGATLGKVEVNINRDSKW